MNIKIKSYIFITCSLIGGALFPLALKVADNSGISIYAFMFLAYLIAAPASLFLVFAKNKTGRLKEYIKKPKEFLFIGILGFINLAFVDYGLIYAEKFISASLATVIYRTQPLLMLIFIPLILRERISKIQIVALMLAFFGIYLALSTGSLSIFSGTNTNIVIFLVVMTLISAFATVYLKRYTTNMESTMFMFNLIALFISFGLFLYANVQLPSLNLSTWISLLYIGLIANIAVPFLYYSAFRVLKTTIVTNLYFLSPFITILFAGLLLQEPIYLYYLIIAILVAVGIFIQRFDKKGGTYIAKGKNALQVFDVTSAFIENSTKEIYSYIKGGGRALAIRLEKNKYSTGLDERIFKERDCVVFTNVSPHKDASKEEIKFINKIINPNDDEVILIALGEPAKIESAFEELAS